MADQIFPIHITFMYSNFESFFNPIIVYAHDFQANELIFLPIDGDKKTGRV